MPVFEEPLDAIKRLAPKRGGMLLLWRIVWTLYFIWILLPRVGLGGSTIWQAFFGLPVVLFLTIWMGTTENKLRNAVSILSALEAAELRDIAFTDKKFRFLLKGGYLDSAEPVDQKVFGEQTIREILGRCGAFRSSHRWTAAGAGALLVATIAALRFLQDRDSTYSQGAGVAGFLGLLGVGLIYFYAKAAFRIVGFLKSADIPVMQVVVQQRLLPGKIGDYARWLLRRAQMNAKPAGLATTPRLR